LSDLIYSGTTITPVAVANEYIQVEEIRIINDSNQTRSVKFDEPVRILLKLFLKTEVKNISFGFGVTTIDNIPLFTTRSNVFEHIQGNSKFSFEVTIHHNLRAGLYNLTFGAASGNFSYIYMPDIISFEILNFGNSPYNFNDYGIINCKSVWEQKNVIEKKIY
jgi:hypothetical protein